MGKSILQEWRFDAETLNDGTTNYIRPGGSSPEADQVVVADRPLRQAGTASNLLCRISANTVTAASTFVLQASQVDTSLSVSIAASTTGDFEDISNTATLAAADEIVYKMATGVGGTSLDMKMIRMEFDSDADTVTLLGNNSSGSSSFGPNNLAYFSVIGTRSTRFVETEAEWRVTEPCSWEDFAIRTGNNLLDAASPAVARINGIDGNQSVSIPASTSGWFEDMSGTDTLSANDNLTVEIDTNLSTTGNFNLEGTTGNLISTDSEFFMGTAGAKVRLDDNLTRYLPLRCEITVSETTEADTKLAAPFDFTVKNLMARIDRMVGTVNVDYKMRVNGADGNGLVELAAVGVVVDTSNTDTITAGDDINMLVTSPVGGTNFDSLFWGLVGQTSAAPAGFEPAWYTIPNQGHVN